MTATIAARTSPYFYLLSHARRRWPGHAVVFGGVVMAVLCSISAQYGLKHLIDLVAQGPGGASRGVWGAFALLCALVAADNLLWRAAGYSATWAFTAMGGDIREDLFAHLTGQGPGYFADRLPGALAARVSGAAQAAFAAGNGLAWGVIPPAAAGIGAIAFTATVHAGLGAGMAVAALLIGLLMHRMARRATPLHRAHASRAAAVDGEMVDIVGNIGVVRAFGAAWRERRRMGESVAAEIAAHRASLWSMEWLRTVHAILTVLLTASALAAGLMLWQAGRASVGDVALLATLSLTLLGATRDIAVALVEQTQHMARLEEALGTLLVPHALRDQPGAVPLRPGAGAVRFEDVHFAYPGRAPVLHGLSLDIRPGERVGLVGASGAGKSTLLALLQRFHEPDSGRVLVDGQDLREVTLESLHHAMAVVPQDTSLFHRSVLENIRYGRPDATEPEVLRAAAMAHCSGFIEALPEGYATIVGNRGVKLSGGQRQRLAIARAILADKPILLLDEATSALDSESENAIQAALDGLMRGRTVIAIAHRLSTLQNFDRIVVLDAGRIVEDGPPSELASRPGPYRELLLRQQAGPVPDLPEAA